MSRDNPVVLRNGKVSVNCLDWPVSRGGWQRCRIRRPCRKRPGRNRVLRARPNWSRSRERVAASNIPDVLDGTVTDVLHRALDHDVAVAGGRHRGRCGGVDSPAAEIWHRWCFCAGARSLGWLDGAAHATAVVAGPKPTAAITRAATPARRSAILIRRPVPSGAVLAVFPFAGISAIIWDASSASLRSSAYARRECNSVERHPSDFGDLDVLVRRVHRRESGGDSGARSCGRVDLRSRTSSRCCPAVPGRFPWIPVSSSTSRIAVCSAVSPWFDMALR